MALEHTEPGLFGFSPVLTATRTGNFLSGHAQRFIEMLSPESGSDSDSA